MPRGNGRRLTYRERRALFQQIDPLSGLETHVDNGARAIVDVLGKMIERIQGDEGDDK
jgi:hypothetical protein